MLGTKLQSPCHSFHLGVETCLVLSDATDFCFLGSCFSNEHVVPVNFSELKLGLQS